ncbi:MAG: glycosyltransferase family 4 protein [Thermodesulfobacteriota bacterium]
MDFFSESRLIAFYADGLPFDGATIFERGLGGSESALYFLAREFAAMGHRVQVFSQTSRPGSYDGVEYGRVWDFPRAAVGQIFDVFIVSRFPQVLALPFRSSLIVMWNHDILDYPENYRQATFRADLFFTLSAYHEAEYLAQLPDLAPYFHRTRNGLDLALIQAARRGAPKQKNKVIYASRPERGLDLLLKQIWPRLLAARPQLELYIAGYQAPDKPGYEHIPQLMAQTPGVIPLGSLAKPEFYRHLAEAALLLYPCCFPEISCITALEAQALGTPIITTRDFALPETVGVPHYLIGGRPVLPEYQEAFISRALEYLADDRRYREDTAQARRWVEENYSWRTIAKEWLELFARLLDRGRPQIKPDYSLFLLGNDSILDNAPFPGSLAPPPKLIKRLPKTDKSVDLGEIQHFLEREESGDWVLVVDPGEHPLSLPHLGIYLEAQRLDWFGFRVPPTPPGHWDAVLFRRNRPLLPENGLEVRLG